MTDKERLESYKWVSATRPLTREEVWWLIEQVETNQDLHQFYELSCKRNNEANVRIGGLIKERDLYMNILDSCECGD